MSVFKKDKHSKEIVNLRTRYVINTAIDIEAFRIWASETLTEALNTKPKENVIKAVALPYVMSLYFSEAGKADSELCSFVLDELFDGFGEAQFTDLVKRFNAKVQ